MGGVYFVVFIFKFRYVFWVFFVMGITVLCIEMFWLCILVIREGREKDSVYSDQEVV